MSEAKCLKIKSPYNVLSFLSLNLLFNHAYYPLKKYSNCSNNNENAIPIPTGSCPTIDTLPSIEVCQGKNSTCWSVDQPDVDCENNALCCFDGCINACYFDGDNPPPQTTPAPAAIPAQQPVPPANQQTQQQAGGGGGGAPQNSYVPPPAPAPQPRVS